MSTYLGSIRRVYTGWRAIPGKHLIIYDDCFVLARASALDGAFRSGPLGGLLSGAAKSAQHPTARQLQDGLTPTDLVSRHRDNWLIDTSDVTSASLRHRIHLGAWRRLTLHTVGRTRTVDYEPGPNPDDAVLALMHQVLGDRMSDPGAAP